MFDYKIVLKSVELPCWVAICRWNLLINLHVSAGGATGSAQWPEATAGAFHHSKPHQTLKNMKMLGKWMFISQSIICFENSSPSLSFFGVEKTVVARCHSFYSTAMFINKKGGYLPIHSSYQFQLEPTKHRRLTNKTQEIDQQTCWFSVLLPQPTVSAEMRLSKHAACCEMCVKKICIYTRIYMYIYMYKYVCIHVCIYTCIYIYIYRNK